MSVVTGVIIVSQQCDDYNERVGLLIQKLNEWIANDIACGGGKLNQVDEHCRSGKHPEVSVWGGGFNYLSWNEFIEYAKTLPWKEKLILPDEQKIIMIVSPDQRPAEVVFLA